jgi:hypothetical protein
MAAVVMPHRTDHATGNEYVLAAIPPSVCRRCIGAIGGSSALRVASHRPSVIILRSVIRDKRHELG